MIVSENSNMAPPEMTLAERCRAIRCLVLDVDGVLTRGGITYTGSGEELKTFHVRDGSGIKAWQRAGHRVAIISGRTSHAVDHRAAELNITSVQQGASDKRAAWERLLATFNVPGSQVACMGDDVPDLPLFRSSGLAIAVADACPEVLREAHLVTRLRGGEGAVREAIEVILRGQGLWEVTVSRCWGA